jgi:hypothetical protein
VKKHLSTTDEVVNYNNKLVEDINNNLSLEIYMNCEKEHDETILQKIKMNKKQVNERCLMTIEEYYLMKSFVLNK